MQVIRFICNGIEILGTLEFTWTDHFLNTLSLSLIIFYAASEMLQYILASSILCQSTKFSWNMFCLTNQETATTFYIASYAFAILNTYTYIRNAAALPEYTCKRYDVHVYMYYEDIFFGVGIFIIKIRGKLVGCL